jgi:transposase
MTRHTNADGLEVRVKSPQRGQVMMHLHTLDELIRQDHPARAVWAYACTRDMSPWFAEIRAVEGGAGRDAVDPRILLALWLLATIEGIGSARRLADLCERDFAYLWICGEVTVNRDLLNTFRSSHPEALDKIMTDTIGVLLHHELVQLTRVSQDGMRVRASAGKSSFRRAATLAAHLAEAEEQVQECRRQADDDQGGRSQQEAARQRAASEREQRIQQAIVEGQKLQERRDQQKRNAGTKARASTTDPEARVMKMADGGYRPAYNVQFATDTASRLIVGVDVTNEGSDSGQMGPMLDQLQQNYGKVPADYLVDGGFSSREDTTEVELRGVHVYAPIKKAEKLLEEGKDPYARHRGDSDEYFAFRQRMKTPEAQTIYRERCSTAEFSNAGCRNRGLQQFRVRGLAKTRIIAVWQALAHNLQMILYHLWLPIVCPA